MESAVSTVSQDNSTFNIVDTWKKNESNNSESSERDLEQYLQHYLWSHQCPCSCSSRTPCWLWDRVDPRNMEWPRVSPETWHPTNGVCERWIVGCNADVQRNLCGTSAKQWEHHFCIRTKNEWCQFSSLSSVWWWTRWNSTNKNEWHKQPHKYRSIKELFRMAYISGLVGRDTDNIGVRPSVGQVELLRVVCGDAVRADCQDSLVLPFPCRMLRDQETLQLNVLMYFSRCSHYLSLRGTLYLEMMKTKKQQQSIFSNSIHFFVIFEIINQKILRVKHKQCNLLFKQFWQLSKHLKASQSNW